VMANTRGVRCYRNSLCLDSSAGRGIFEGGQDI
jgi:hypothetical protein